MFLYATAQVLQVKGWEAGSAVPPSVATSTEAMTQDLPDAGGVVCWFG